MLGFIPERCSPCPGFRRQVSRIIEELENSPHELVKAIYLVDRGEALTGIGRDAIDDSFLYAFGPDSSFISLEREAAYELFETFWPDTYRLWEGNSVPGLRFDPEDFLNRLCARN